MSQRGQPLNLRKWLSGLAANQPSRLLLGRPSERRVRAREYCNATSKYCGSVGSTSRNLRGLYSNPKQLSRERSLVLCFWSELTPAIIVARRRTSMAKCRPRSWRATIASRREGTLCPNTGATSQGRAASQSRSVQRMDEPAFCTRVRIGPQERLLT